MGDPDQEVRVEALRLLRRLSDEDGEERLLECLESPNFHIRLAAIGYIALYGSEEECGQVREEVLEELLATVGDEAELARVQVAKLLGSSGRPDLKKYLLKLRDDPAVSVVRQVIQRLCRDVTERRRLEEENEFLREYYERILDMMPVGLGVKRNVDGTPKVAFENQKLKEMFHGDLGDSAHAAWHDSRLEGENEEKAFLTEGGAYARAHLPVYLQLFQEP